MFRMFAEASEDIDGIIRSIVSYVYHHSPIYREKKRIKLSGRLHRIFFMDALEGSLDVIVRGGRVRRV